MPEQAYDDPLLRRLAMPFRKSNLHVKSKIWIEDEKGNMVFGTGRLDLLEAVAEHGSLLAASKKLHMSYRAAWGKIRATEARLGRPLLTRRVGGTRGGGSKLTPLGKEIIKRFRCVKSLCLKTSNTLFEDLFVAEFTDKKEE
jgi:molybdate transport system regulatory protein